MRRWMVIPFLLLIAAKGKKTTPEPEPPPPAPAPAPVEEPPPPPPPAEPVVVKNANFNISFVFMDGSTRSGHVTGVERTEDFVGDEGWTTDASKLKLTVESGTSEKQVTWNDVKSITIAPGKMPDELDCTYTSDTSPWTYECTLRTTSTVVLKDGTKGVVTNRHLWRFTFEDGTTFQFQAYKYTLREQDSKEVEYGTEQAENYAIYTRLQDQIRTDLKGKMPKTITVQ